MKTCSKCGREQELSAFGKNRRMADGLSYYCRECSTKFGQASRRKPHIQKRERNWFLLRTYGISLDDLERMLADQGGCCAVCRVKLLVTGKSPTSLVVDHCHETGKVRGLLCAGCNCALGYAADDPDRLRALADYLENSRQTPD